MRAPTSTPRAARRALIAAACCLLPTFLLPVAAAAVVVPGSLELVEGGSNNCIPLTGNADFDRYQQVFDGTEFAGPIWISEIRFRRDSLTPSPFSNGFTNVQIALSTTSAAPDALSTTFAANQGGDLSVVFSGAITISSASSGGSPAPFDVSIVFGTPFYYDPAGGNLLLDWWNFGGDSYACSASDAAFATDSVSRLYAAASGATTGTADTTGLVTEFVPLVGDHPCCETGDFGCATPAYQNEICDVDPFCCNTAWDNLCVSRVTTVVGLSCNACVERVTRSAYDAGIRACVCAGDSYCCDTRWDGICVGEVDAFACGTCADQGFVYVNNNDATTNSVSGFAVEQSFSAIPGGFLTPTYQSPYTTGVASGFTANVGSIAATRNRNCVFATNATAGSVTPFQRTTGGGLQAGAAQSAGSNPVPVAVDEIQDLVFVGNFSSADVSVYGFASNCALTPIGTYTVSPADSPLDLEVSADGSKLFVSNDFSNAVSVMQIGAGGSSLTHVAGSPFAAGFAIHGIALSPDDSRVYSCSLTGDDVSGFAVGAGGGLTTVPSSPFAAGDEPLDALVSNAGDYLIVSNNGSVDLDVFGIAGNGSLSSIGTFPTDSPSQGPAGLASNDVGDRLFVANGGFDPAPAGSASVSVYSLSGGGALSPISFSPFDTGADSTPSGIVYVPEPGAVPLLLSGLAALLGLAGRSRRR